MANSNNRNDENPAVVLILILLLAAIVFATTPGMLVMYTAERSLNLGLDQGQMWTFAVLSSLVIFGIFYWRQKNFTIALTYYSILSIGIIVISLIAYFGFKAKFIETGMNLYFR